jgi:hypothetical protein
MRLELGEPELFVEKTLWAAKSKPSAGLGSFTSGRCYTNESRSRIIKSDDCLARGMNYGKDINPLLSRR